MAAGGSGLVAVDAAHQALGAAEIVVPADAIIRAALVDGLALAVAAGFARLAAIGFARRVAVRAAAVVLADALAAGFVRAADRVAGRLLLPIGARVEPATLALLAFDEGALSVAAGLTGKAAQPAGAAVTVVVLLIDAFAAAAPLRQIANHAAGAAVVGIALVGRRIAANAVAADLAGRARLTGAIDAFLAVAAFLAARAAVGRVGFEDVAVVADAVAALRVLIVAGRAADAAIVGIAFEISADAIAASALDAGSAGTHRLAIAAVVDVVFEIGALAVAAGRFIAGAKVALLLIDADARGAVAPAAAIVALPETAGEVVGAGGAALASQRFADFAMGVAADADAALAGFARPDAGAALIRFGVADFAFAGAVRLADALLAFEAAAAAIVDALLGGGVVGRAGRRTFRDAAAETGLADLTLGAGIDAMFGRRVVGRATSRALGRAAAEQRHADLILGATIRTRRRLDRVAPKQHAARQRRQRPGERPPRSPRRHDFREPIEP